MQKLKTYLFTEYNGLQLALFRIILGFALLWEMFYFVKLDVVSLFFTETDFNFNYLFLPLSPLPDGGLWTVIVILAFAAFAFMVGFKARLASAIYCIGFAYIFLLEKAFYNNHLYLIILLTFLFAFIPSDYALSIKAKSKNYKPKVYNWMLGIIQVQVAIVYFYGGIAKLSSDWLIHMQPAKIILATKVQETGLAFLSSDIMVYFMTYGGLLFDLSIAFLLFYKPTRKLGLIGLLGFNVINAWVFNDINIFPYLMMGAGILWFNNEWIVKIFGKKQTQLKESKVKINPLVFKLIMAYLIIQLVLPLRHHVFTPNVDWTGEHQRFSWRMKIQSRSIAELDFAIFNPSNKQFFIEKKSLYGINGDQMGQLIIYPDMVWQFAQHLKKRAIKKYKISNPQVKALVSVKYNGRNPLKVVNQDLNLTKVKYKQFSHNKWIEKLK